MARVRPRRIRRDTLGPRSPEPIRPRAHVKPQTGSCVETGSCRRRPARPSRKLQVSAHREAHPEPPLRSRRRDPGYGRPASTGRPGPFQASEAVTVGTMSGYMVRPAHGTAAPEPSTALVDRAPARSGIRHEGRPLPSRELSVDSEHAGVQRLVAPGPNEVPVVLAADGMQRVACETVIGVGSRVCPGVGDDLLDDLGRGQSRARP